MRPRARSSAETVRARPVALPGHTLGHFGVLTADGVLFTGDALYQEQIWQQHRLPFVIFAVLVALLPTRRLSEQGGAP